MKLYLFAPIVMTATMVMDAAAPSVLAGVIFYSPDSATASNTNHSSFSPSHLIDGSGLSSSSVTLSNIGTINHNDGQNAEIWRGAAAALPITLTFNFVNPQQLQYVGLWQGVDFDQGVRDFTLRFFDNQGASGSQIGGAFSSVLDTGSGGQGSISLAGRSFDVGPRNAVESFTMEITSVAVPLSTVHLGEVMVASSAAVPEPSTCAFLGLGAFGIMCARYRRRKAG